MATDTTTPAPLSDDEAAQLRALQERQAACDAANAAAARKAELERLGTLKTLVDLIATDKVQAALAAAASDETLGFANLERVRRFAQMYNFDVIALKQVIDGIQNPTPTVPA